MSQSGNQISGASAKLKPWHYLAIGVVCVSAVILVPKINGWVSGRRNEDRTAAAMAAVTGSGGEPWHTPNYPDVTKVTLSKPALVPPPPPPRSSAPIDAPLVTQPPTVNALHGQGNDVPNYVAFSGSTAQTPPGQSQSQMRGQGGATPQATPVAANEAGSMGALLKPTETLGFVATRLPHPWATIEQGRVIPCNSVTPMNSELPGFVKAQITNDVYGADGTTVLVNRGSHVFGEIAHGLVSGQDRLFVLWRSILTPAPDFVRITLNSPAADELGEAGLPGDINHHTWQKIGGALMLSGADTLLQGIGSGLGQALSHGGSNNGSGANLNFYQFQSQGSSLASDLLKNTVTIPDTLHRDQALACSIFVSGDLDFSSVYSLRMTR
jgi:type IV secretion system protein VirB10